MENEETAVAEAVTDVATGENTDKKSLEVQDIPKDTPKDTAKDIPAEKPESVTQPGFKLTIPDGTTQTDADRIVSYAKEQGLSQEVAQEMLDRESIAISASELASADRLVMLKEQWVKEARADESFGGESFTENVNIAKQGVDNFASPELVEILNQSGLGNNVEFLKHFKRLGDLVRSDGFVSGINSQPDTRTEGEIFYGKKQ